MTDHVGTVIYPQSLISLAKNEGASLREDQAAASKIAKIRCDLLQVTDSPRLTGENSEHIQVLMESSDEFPPILVHKPTMRVVDGMHRLAATRLRGHEEIKVQFFSGSEEEIFVLSVQENIAHGLPLSLADRKAAAARIVKAHPEWSDRRIASVAGLSHKTIGTIRASPQGASGENTQLRARRGHDGRLRPLNSSEGRRLAAELLEDNPTASLRTVARKAGISPGTARDVRDRLKRGLDPLLGRPGHQRATAAADRQDPGGRPERASECPAPTGAEADRTAAVPAQRSKSNGSDADPLQESDMDKILHRLRSDPTLRFSDTGRSILRHLYHSTNNAVAFGQFVDKVPHHRAATIAELAQANAELWWRLAVQLQRRSC
jgi:ParB-like chromosome segregation protein Spo0J